MHAAIATGGSDADDCPWRNRAENNRAQSTNCPWENPPDGWIKLNSDGALTSSDGVAGAGGVARQRDGFIGAWCKTYCGIFWPADYTSSCLPRWCGFCEEARLWTGDLRTGLPRGGEVMGRTVKTAICDWSAPCEVRELNTGFSSFVVSLRVGRLILQLIVVLNLLFTHWESRDGCLWAQVFLFVLIVTRMFWVNKAHDLQ